MKLKLRIAFFQRKREAQTQDHVFSTQMQNSGSGSYFSTQIQGLSSWSRFRSSNMNFTIKLTFSQLKCQVHLMTHTFQAVDSHSYLKTHKELLVMLINSLEINEQKNAVLTTQPPNSLRNMVREGQILLHS